MKVEDLDIGDVVYAASDIINDGSMPGAEENQILATEGSRGVISMIGHIEDDPQRTVLLIRFEDEALNLGNPIGCWPEDLVSESSLN